MGGGLSSPERKKETERERVIFRSGHPLLLPFPPLLSTIINLEAGGGEAGRRAGQLKQGQV